MLLKALYVALLVHFTRLTLRAAGMAYNTCSTTPKADLARGLGYTKIEEREVPDVKDASVVSIKKYEVPDVDKMKWYVYVKVFLAQFLAN
jgi:hypothetical protein